MTPLEAGGYAQIPDCYENMWYICYCYCIAGHSLGALLYLKAKTLNSGIISLVFFSCFKKLKCVGDVLDSYPFNNLQQGHSIVTDVTFRHVFQLESLCQSVNKNENS